jgi:DNA-binding response OmpR family regulator
MDSVLVIDDERNVRALLAKILGQDQIDVHGAGTGAEGLQMADDLNPDVVLLDIRLPDANGLDILRSL